MGLSDGWFGAFFVCFHHDIHEESHCAGFAVALFGFVEVEDGSEGA
jgi:hypothetical protein